jgi:hypothetical protein
VKKKSRTEHFRNRKSIMERAREERYEDDMTELERIASSVIHESLFV